MSSTVIVMAAAGGLFLAAWLLEVKRVRWLLARRLAWRTVETTTKLVKPLETLESQAGLVDAFEDVASMLGVEPGRMRVDDELQTYCLTTLSKPGWYFELANTLAEAAGTSLAIELTPATRVGDIVIDLAKCRASRTSRPTPP